MYSFSIDYVLSIVFCFGGLEGEVQLLNASLAVQLSNIFIERFKDPINWTRITSGECVLPLVKLDKQMICGLSNCRWPGRFHQVSPSITNQLSIGC